MNAKYSKDVKGEKGCESNAQSGNMVIHAHKYRKKIEEMSNIHPGHLTKQKYVIIIIFMVFYFFNLAGFMLLCRFIHIF